MNENTSKQAASGVPSLQARIFTRVIALEIASIENAHVSISPIDSQGVFVIVFLQTVALRLVCGCMRENISNRDELLSRMGIYALATATVVP